MIHILHVTKLKVWYCYRSLEITLMPEMFVVSPRTYFLYTCVMLCGKWFEVYVFLCMWIDPSVFVGVFGFLALFVVLPFGFAFLFVAYVQLLLLLLHTVHIIIIIIICFLTNRLEFGYFVNTHTIFFPFVYLFCWLTFRFLQSFNCFLSSFSTSSIFFFSFFFKYACLTID